jgi:PAS domain S-box-containing protein
MGDTLHDILEHAAVGVISADAERRIQKANSASCSMLARNAEELLGADFAALSDAGHNAQCLEHIETIRRTGEAGFVAENPLRRRDGSVIWVRFRVTALRATDGSIQGFGAIVEDITAEKAAAVAHTAPLAEERAVRDADDLVQARFRSLFEAMPGAYIVLESDSFRVVGVSDLFLTVTGTERQDLVTRRFFDVFPTPSAGVPPRAVASLHESLNRVRTTGVREEMPLQYWTTRSGGESQGGAEERVFSWLNAPVLNAAGEVEYVIHRTEDVTDRELGRDRLARTLKLQRTAQRTARLGVWQMDVSSGLVTWSEEACTILDLPQGHVSSLHGALSFVLPDGRPELRSAFKTCVRKATSFATDLEIVSKRGWRKSIRIAGQAERDERGRVRAITGSLQNISDRRAREEANHRLADRLAAQVGGITDAFLSLDKAFRITYANPMALRILGLAQGAALGRPLWERPGFAEDGPFATQLRAAIEEQATKRFDEFLAPTGEWLEVHAFPTVGGLTVTLHDVTGRRREQEKLRLLEACMARMNDMVMITEAHSSDEPSPRIVFVNDAFLRRTGYTREEIYGRTPRMLQGPATQRAELDRIGAAVAAGQPVRAELINYSKSGEEYWVEVDIQPVEDGDGHVMHWVAVERETTERRLYQAQLEDKAELLNQVQDGILVRGMDGRISFANRSAERLYGWAPGEMLGQEMHVIYEDPGIAAGPLAELMKSGHWSGQLPQRRRDGTKLIVQARAKLMRNADGTPRAVLGVTTDITERLELEAKLRQSHRLEAVGQLTGGVAHDFNNLLTVIIGNAEILMESLGHDEELREMAEMTMSAAERGAALTSRLLAFSRKQALDPKVVDVNLLLSGLGRMLQRTIGEHIDLKILLSEDIWHAVIDPPQLENAVLNLCINARDAMPNGGSLTVETRNIDLDSGYARSVGDLKPGRYVMITVSDTGTGMTPDVVAQAFEPFFTTKEVGQGSGLGLSMVYGFMKQSGGHVTIYSTPGIGTSVRMYLPHSQSDSATLPLSAPVKQAGGSERILLVEDDLMVREHVTAQLRELGYAVTPAPNAAEALARLKDGGGFDLLFTDIVMPGKINGLELAAESRRLQPGLHVLLTSGYTEHGIAHHNAADPGVRLLSKPYRRRELAEAVRRVLDAVP